MFVDARDIGGGTADDPISISEQQSMLAVRGSRCSQNSKHRNLLPLRLTLNGNLNYKTDYDLGDVVTVLDMGLRADARITEIKEIYESGGLQLELTLGYERVIKIV